MDAFFWIIRRGQEGYGLNQLYNIIIYTMENLINLEDLEGLNQEQIIEKINEANELHKKNVADSDRWVQKILENSKLAEGAIEALAEINGDSSKFADLYKKDPKQWEYLLKKVFGWVTYEQFMAWEPKNDGNLTKAQMEEFYQQKEIEKELDSVNSKLSDEWKEAFKKEFDDIVEGKKLTKDNIKKYIKMALREVEPDMSLLEQEAKSSSISGWYSSKAKDESKIKMDQATTDLLTKMGSYNPPKK